MTGIESDGSRGGAVLDDFGVTADHRAWRETRLAEHPAGAALLGRVVRVDRGFVRLITDEGDALVRIPPAMSRAAAIASGDFVLFDPIRGVLEVAPRRSVLRRRAPGKRPEAQVVATNVDLVMILCGLDGDFNVKRIERYLFFVNESGAVPAILLTKAGLVADPEPSVDEVRRLAPDVRAFAIDVKAGIAADLPASLIAPGATAALVGSSGAGKSTLTNYLLGAQVQSTKTVRKHDDRGRHTTSSREVFRLPNGGLVIDTPGMRELGAWGEEDALGDAFPDLVELAASCRFTDCRHEREPECAVRLALEEGRITPSRVASFRGVGEELARTSRPVRSTGKRHTRRG